MEGDQVDVQWLYMYVGDVQVYQFFCYYLVGGQDLVEVVVQFVDVVVCVGVELGVYVIVYQQWQVGVVEVDYWYVQLMLCVECCLGGEVGVVDFDQVWLQIVQYFVLGVVMEREVVVIVEWQWWCWYFVDVVCLVVVGVGNQYVVVNVGIVLEMVMFGFEIGVYFFVGRCVEYGYIGDVYDGFFFVEFVFFVIQWIIGIGSCLNGVWELWVVLSLGKKV